MYKVWVAAKKAMFIPARYARIFAADMRYELIHNWFTLMLIHAISLAMGSAWRT